MKIQAIAADQIELLVGSVPTAAPQELAMLPSDANVAKRAASVKRGEATISKRTRRDVLEEALLDGFLGRDECDYQGMVNVIKRIRDTSPGLTVQLIKALVASKERAATTNVEQQAVFIFGDLPAPQQQQASDAIDVD